MKKDVFNSWLKELISLVFVQTFQAFLIAIILSMIVRLLTESLKSALDVRDQLNATGVLAIFALASLSKIELLIKNIFGLTSGVGDPSLQGGKKALTAGTVIGLAGLKRTFDNGRKILGGTKGMIRGGVNLWKANNDLREAQQGNGPEGGALNGNTKTQKQLTGSNGGAGGSSGGNISTLITEIRQLNSTLQSTNLDADKDKKSKKLDDLNKAIEDAKKNLHDSGKELTSGILETVGAAHGAVAGGVIGLAHGEVAEHVGKGMGAGDIAGQTITNIIMDDSRNSAKSTIVREAVRTHNLNKAEKANAAAYKKLKEDIASDNEKNFKDLEAKIDMLSKNKEKDNSRLNKNRDISNE